LHRRVHFYLHFDLSEFYQKNCLESLRTTKNIVLTSKSKNLTRNKFCPPFCMKTSHCGLVLEISWRKAISFPDTLIHISAHYRIDSDIPYYYGTFCDKETFQKVSHSKFVKWKQRNSSYTNARILNVVRSKSKAMAIFVSNCDAYSRRLDLIHNLSKYISIDIYGKCGTLR
jgi:hypothetical protein